MPFDSIKAAEAVAGSLSKPSKMPGYAYGIPARHCSVGSKLVLLENSVCSKCYALKGRYMFPNVQNAQEERFQSLQHPQWVEAMVYMINRRSCEYFRWHDSGDLQGVWHLENIVKIAEQCPKTKFWLPTREKLVVSSYLKIHGNFPSNLTVRLSGAMIDAAPPVGFPNTSTVVRTGATCPAPRQGNMCGSCRACWDGDVSNISYLKH